MSELKNTAVSMVEVAELSQELKVCLRASDAYNDLPALHRECLESIMSNIARICRGEHLIDDHYSEIIGDVMTMQPTAL